MNQLLPQLFAAQVSQAEGEIPHQGSIQDIAHFTLEELARELAGSEMSQGSRHLLNTASRSSLMEVPPSHARWALMPRDDPEDAAPKVAGVVAEVDPALGNASGGYTPSLTK